MADAVAAADVTSPPLNRRLTFVRWVRKTHGWFGLWGALLGLMTGVSGVWLNHRAVMKLPLPDQQQSSAQVALPDPRPQTAEDHQPCLGPGELHCLESLRAGDGGRAAYLDYARE